LLERAKAGVQVRVIYDSFGSKATSREFFELLKKGGVQVLEYNPVDPAGLLTKGPLLNNRDHRKLLIVDGRVAFVGGINISDVYAGSSAARLGDVPFDERPWRDTQLQVEGPVVADLQKSFIALWEKEKKEKLSDPKFMPQLARGGPHVIRAIESSRDQAFNPLYVTLLSAISSAQAEVHITMAYFVPDPRLLEELKAAAKRGVDVKIILPSRTDGWVVFHAGRSFYDELLESGVKIYERKNRLLHSKYAVIDGVWSTIGSSNLDWRSLLHNLELNVVILGPDFGKRLKALFDKDLGLSEPITLENWRGRPLKDRAREAAARAWAYLL
jgi:cardiolipin synthase A/B